MKIKKLLAIILAMIMSLSILSVAAFALAPEGGFSDYTYLANGTRLDGFMNWQMGQATATSILNNLPNNVWDLYTSVYISGSFYEYGTSYLTRTSNSGNGQTVASAYIVNYSGNVWNSIENTFFGTCNGYSDAMEWETITEW